jgi:hypothetical protein
MVRVAIEEYAFLERIICVPLVGAAARVKFIRGEVRRRDLRRAFPGNWLPAPHTRKSVPLKDLEPPALAYAIPGWLLRRPRVGGRNAEFMTVCGDV